MPAVHPFALARPRSVTEAVAVLAASHGEARIMAGGQSLTPLLTLGFSAPAVVVSLDRCEGVDRLDHTADGLRIGAMVTTARLAAATDVAHRFPLIAYAASQVGSPHVRNFGTVVGNVCHAEPGSDLIPALACHDTVIELHSPAGRRSVPLDAFITGPFTTTIDESEMAAAIELAADDGDWRFGYRKLVKRSGDLAMATCAVRLRSDGGRVGEARVAVGGAVSQARRLTTVEQHLNGVTLDEAADRALQTDLSPDTAPYLMPDHHAPLDYLELMLPRFVAATVGDAVRDGPGR